VPRPTEIYPFTRKTGDGFNESCPASRFAFDSFLSIDSYSKTLSLFAVSVPKGSDLEEEIAALM
jgi:hypothetical protein